MPYLNHVVEFRAAADVCFAYRGAIDCTLRLDFNVIADDGDSALAHFVPRAIGLAREAEAVAADYDSVLDQDAMADAAVLAHGAVRVGEEIVADCRASIDGDEAVQHDVASYLDFFIERYREAFDAEIDAFVTSVEQGEAPLVGFEDGRRALILAEAAMKSAVEGRSVNVGEIK